jgi:L-ascorbate metabolism protein UlaG (beta-lactamase superfamily)
MSERDMIEPALSDDAFLADVRKVRGEPGLHLWWLGQSGFLLHHEGRFLLLDPYLSDSLTRKYANTDKPHVRMTRRVIDPGRLNFVHVVTSSHNHTDHLDADTVRPLLAANPKLKLVIPEANREFVAQRLQVAPHVPEGVEDGMSVKAGGFEIHGVPAAHEQRELDELGRDRFMGFVIKAGRWTVYHSGDTVLFDGMVEKLWPFHVDVALLPINGRSPKRRVAGNLDGKEAAWLANDIGAKLAIPCHYDMFEFNTASPEEFMAECEKVGQPYKILRSGDRWSGQ